MLRLGGMGCGSVGGGGGGFLLCAAACSCPGRSHLPRAASPARGARHCPCACWVVHSLCAPSRGSRFAARTLAPRGAGRRGCPGAWTVPVPAGCGARAARLPRSAVLASDRSFCAFCPQDKAPWARRQCQPRPPACLHTPAAHMLATRRRSASGTVLSRPAGRTAGVTRRA